VNDHRKAILRQRICYRQLILIALRFSDLVGNIGRLRCSRLVLQAFEIVLHVITINFDFKLIWKRDVDGLIGSHLQAHAAEKHQSHRWVVLEGSNVVWAECEHGAHSVAILGHVWTI
jgi:hypothetical protein